MHFRELNLIAPILTALQAKGYENPTPIQAAAIPPVLTGKDLLGCAQTGTGKTAAFALPILQNLYSRPSQGPKKIRALILAPTRELAVQIGESFQTYGLGLNLRFATIFGGVNEGPQKTRLRQGVDILVATPGRLMDLHGQRALSLSDVEIFVLDEADRMLDMGFIHDVRRIAGYLPTRRQTLLFSATMPPEIRSLANNLMRDPVKVEVAAVSAAADNIDQSVHPVPRNLKPSLLRHLLADSSISRALVFTRTKHGADRVCRTLERQGLIAEAIHGNKTQGARQRALLNFKTGSTRFLIATDIAARGIDVTDISHVINYDLPEVPETYVHRIGRTARAGASGIAVTFCDPEERPYLLGVERLIRQRLRVAATPALEAPPQNQHSPQHSRSHATPGQARFSHPVSREHHRPQNPDSRAIHHGTGQESRPAHQGAQENRPVQHGRKPFWKKSGSFNRKRGRG